MPAFSKQLPVPRRSTASMSEVTRRDRYAEMVSLKNVDRDDHFDFPLVNLCNL